MLRKLGAFAATLTALTTMLLTSPSSAVASDGNMWATVQNVSAQVNRTGGITVRGEVNCRAAVELWQQQNATTLEDHAVVLVSLDWTAYQPVGRRGMVTASWGSDHMSPCYSKDEPDTFWPWATTHAGSTADFYVYSTSGRFVKGTVHIDVTMFGGFDLQTGEILSNVIIAPDPQGPGTFTDIAVEVFTAQQFDVRAR